jgi:adenosylcobinamide kinase/adenosylcobinamide-phosphate guanylyltransferase
MTRVPTGFTLLLGGARSGKSDLAVRIGRAWAGPVTFVATADVRGDDDLAARVARHRADRPDSWHIVEEPHDVANAIRSVDPGQLVIVDCITLWVSGLCTDGASLDDIGTAAGELADCLASRADPSVVVSNEVGLGVHPSTAIGRVFRDALGHANQRLARQAHRTLLLVAGRAVRLHDVEELW